MEETKKPVVSIIVPVYNVEPFVGRCIDSILAQTYQNFKLILVDDGSKDQSGAICDGYASKDSRIHVIHQTYRGVSGARNTGIDWVMGNRAHQWILFIDSDDWIAPITLERLMDAVQQYDVKVSVCGYQETSGEYPPLAGEPVFSLKTPEEFFVPYNTNAIVVWGKLFHRDCIGNIRFPEGKIHEDEMTTHQFYFSQGKVAVTPAPLYYYFRNRAGIMKSKWTPKRLDSVEAFQSQLRYFKKYGFARAFEVSAVAYLHTIAKQKRCVMESDLSEEEKNRHLKYLNGLFPDALLRYGHFLLKRRNADMLCEVFPGIQPAFTTVRKAYRRISGKGDTK